MFPDEIDFWLYGALAHAARASDRTEALAIVRDHEANLVAWAARCPHTFANKAALVRAERLRLEGSTLEAELQFERAIQLARENRFVHEEALAHELAARFYESRGLAVVAHSAWRAARACYVEWGALGKVMLMDQSAGVEWSLAERAGDVLEDSLERLELADVIEALGAVSSSLELETLVDELMRTALQEAGAERACLLLLSEELKVRAEATSRDGAIRVYPTNDAVSGDRLPETVLRFVLRTREKVAVEDGQVPLPFRDDPYLQSRRALWLLCLPIVVRGKSIGLLYLENTLTKPAFRARGLALLDVIASQAAISIENARLYARIHEAERRMSRAEQVSRTGSFGWNPATGELDWSDEMFRIYEVERPASLEVMRVRTHPDDVALFDALMNDSTRLDGKTGEYRIVSPGGVVKHLSVIASTIGSYPHATYVGTVRDVTETKRAEEALQRTQSALAEMTRVASLGEMAAAIAHEVNQPLSAVGLNASTCVRWLDASQLNIDEAREAARRISRDAARAGAVIARLRALFSKTEGVRLAVDLPDAVNEVLALLRNRIRSAGATLRVRSAEPLRPAQADRVQLQQVIMNLVTNALESMRDAPEGERQLVVTISEVDGGKLRCEVEDSGSGVPASQRDRIFQPFYSTKADGMGIGLSIAKSIVESHGGSLRVRPNGEARGSTFYFDLPSDGAPPAPPSPP